mmetsp:Transcript_8895/g.18426  ORF Transcript_8895/g.18426 Transcript_8895/m.18426 type:complete len:169 (-) Transcript_8895:299-805(-)
MTSGHVEFQIAKGAPRSGQTCCCRARQVCEVPGRICPHGRRPAREHGARLGCGGAQLHLRPALAISQIIWPTSSVSASSGAGCKTPWTMTSMAQKKAAEKKTWPTTQRSTIAVMALRAIHRCVLPKDTPATLTSQFGSSFFLRKAIQTKINTQITTKHCGFVTIAVTI